MCRVTHCDITSAFSETIVSRWSKFSGRIFQAICGESLLGPFSTAAVKDPWIGWMVWKEIYFQPKSLWTFALPESSMPRDHQKSSSVAHEQTALYSIALHYFVFILVSPVRKLFLHMALFCITSLCMCCGWTALCIAVTEEQVEKEFWWPPSTLCICRMSEQLLMLWCLSVCHTHPWHKKSSHLKQTALCPQRKCLTRKLF